MTRQEIIDQLGDNTSNLVGILHDDMTFIGPMSEVHAMLRHEWLIIPKDIMTAAEQGRLIMENQAKDRRHHADLA
jgi:hypothetical protein